MPTSPQYLAPLAQGKSVPFQGYIFLLLLFPLSVLLWQQVSLLPFLLLSISMSLIAGDNLTIELFFPPALPLLQKGMDLWIKHLAIKHLNLSKTQGCMYTKSCSFPMYTNVCLWAFPGCLRPVRCCKTNESWFVLPLYTVNNTRSIYLFLLTKAAWEHSCLSKFKVLQWFCTSSEVTCSLFPT